MAYAHGQYQVNLTATGLTAATSGVVGLKWACGYVPHVIRAFSVVNTSTVADMALFRGTLERRGLTTAVVALATISGTATGGMGVVFYSADLNATIAPGQELQFHITTAAGGASLIQACVWVEPKWEEPGNFSNVKPTA